MRSLKQNKLHYNNAEKNSERGGKRGNSLKEKAAPKDFFQMTQTNNNNNNNNFHQ